MKRLLQTILIAVLLVIKNAAFSQCATSNLNWDNLAYYVNSGDYAQYTAGGVTCGVTDALMQTQKFALHTNTVTVTSNYSNTNSLGNSTTHTGDGSSYGTGADVQFKLNGTLTFSFATSVTNIKFSLYDIDGSQRVQVTALDGVTSRNVTLAKVSGTVLTIAGSPGTTPTATANATALATSSTDGTVNVDIAGPVTSFTITVTLSGTPSGEDGSFYLSDLQACVTGSFATNYYDHLYTKPYTGQPAYILAVHDQNTVFMIDPATGGATSLFTDNSITEINNLAYDSHNRLLYYGCDGVERLSPAGLPDTVKFMKRYNFNTASIDASFFISNINSAPLNVPTFKYGLESGAACFYNGNLYLGVEGNGSGNAGRKSIIYRIDLDGSQNPTGAAQVFATASSSHDWSDFTMKDGILYNHNSNSSGRKYQVFNMTTQALTNHTATAGNTPRQVTIQWNGQIIWIGDSVATHDGTNVLGTRREVFSNPGSVEWILRAGDAGEAFKPQADFGDAPASYDPGSGDPAIHEQNANLKLGSGFDREWVTRGQTAPANSDNYDDALAYVPTFNPANDNYLLYIDVYNNTGANATVCGWLDYDGDGIFETGEGISITVGSSASVQNVTMYWPWAPSSLAFGSYTYLRLRIAPASLGMTTSNPTGYFNTGEVEDYRVPVNTYPLATKLFNFNAAKKSGTVQLDWKVDEDKDLLKYEIQKSSDGNNWQTIAIMERSSSIDAVKNYNYVDDKPNSRNFYRLQLNYSNAESKLSHTRQVNFEEHFNLSVQPNPAKEKTNLIINADEKSQMTLQLINELGMIVYKKQIDLNKGTNQVELPLTGFHSGSYIVHVINNGLIVNRKLLIK